MRNHNIVEAFRFAFAGLWYTLRTQRNMRAHLAIASFVVVLGLWLQLSTTEWALVALASGLVLVSELMNTVVEKLVDLVCPEYHPLAKIVKDVMAGAVALAALIAVIVGLIILGPQLWKKFMG